MTDQSPSDRDAAMTYQTEPYDQGPKPPPDTSWIQMATEPQPPKGGLAKIFIIAGVAAAALVGVIFYVGGVIPHGGVSKESAQRACRTAFGNEWKARQAQTAGGSDTSIIATVTSVELQETWEAKGGWSVNGTVHYTLTTALVAPVQGSIDLTCTATGDDDSPTTTVTNRS